MSPNRPPTYKPGSTTTSQSERNAGNPSQQRGHWAGGPLRTTLARAVPVFSLDPAFAIAARAPGTVALSDDVDDPAMFDTA